METAGKNTIVSMLLLKLAAGLCVVALFLDNITLASQDYSGVLIIAFSCSTLAIVFSVIALILSARQWLIWMLNLPLMAICVWAAWEALRRGAFG